MDKIYIPCETRNIITILSIEPARANHIIFTVGNRYPSKSPFNYQYSLPSIGEYDRALGSCSCLGNKGGARDLGKLEIRGSWEVKKRLWVTGDALWRVQEEFVSWRVAGELGRGGWQVEGQSKGIWELKWGLGSGKWRLGVRESERVLWKGVSRESRKENGELGRKLSSLGSGKVEEVLDSLIGLVSSRREGESPRLWDG